MAVIETFLVFGMGWLLGKGGLPGTQPPKGGGGKGSGTKPSKAPWPGGLPEREPLPRNATMADVEERLADEEAARQAAQETLDKQANEAKQLAKTEQEKAHVEQLRKQRQKALNEWKKDIEKARETAKQGRAG